MNTATFLPARQHPLPETCPTQYARLYLRHELEAYMSGLGYSRVRMKQGAAVAPEIARSTPVRGRIALWRNGVARGSAAPEMP